MRKTADVPLLYPIVYSTRRNSKLTVKAVQPCELPNLLFGPVIQHVHPDVGVVQGSDMLLGVVEQVGRFAAHGEIYVYRGIVPVFPSRKNRFLMFFRIEVFSPHPHAKICQANERLLVGCLGNHTGHPYGIDIKRTSQHETDKKSSKQSSNQAN